MAAVKDPSNDDFISGLEVQDSKNGIKQNSTSDTIITNNHARSDVGRDARIALRRARIEALRMSKLRPNTSDDVLMRRVKKVELENRKVSISKQQISIGIKRLARVKEHGKDLVTNIREGITARESFRRSENVKKQALWENRELQEEICSRDAEAELNRKWDNVEKLKNPYDLNQLLQQQKKECQELLAIKSNLCEEYMSEVKINEELYVRELKRQSDAIGRMEVQYKSYRVACTEEAEVIEQAFVEERNEMTQAHASETNKLFETRKVNEVNYMHERENRIDEYMKQLELLRVGDSEEYNLVKIKLETDVQVLEQQLQQMRVTYLLNQEKLEYNYQVLKKREEENGTILGAKKRKINRLAENFNVLKVKSLKQDKLFQQENSSLTDDYNHLTEQYKQLQKKFRHFQLADAKRFKEIWEMNDEEAKEIMRKLLLADRIISEQQLGFRWKPPSQDLFRNVDPLSFRQNTKAISGPKNIHEAEADFETVMNLKGAINGQQKESLSSKLDYMRKTSKTMKKTLELLCNEAGFLVEDKLQKLLSPLHSDEQSLMRLDSIFKALGVVSVEDIKRLSSYFLDPEKGHDNDVLIHPNHVISAIRKFVDGTKGQDLTSPELSSLSGSGDLETVKEEFDVLTAEESAVNANKMQEDYWNRMLNVIDEKCYRTWNAVYLGMEKYHGLLTERSKTSQKISLLQQQNSELKNLMRQYMHARINDELQVPPTHIMLAQAGLLPKL